jgi:hypothetical protein
LLFEAYLVQEQSLGKGRSRQKSLNPRNGISESEKSDCDVDHNQTRANSQIHFHHV